jgi:hypothetical protein
MLLRRMGAKPEKNTKAVKAQPPKTLENPCCREKPLLSGERNETTPKRPSPLSRQKRPASVHGFRSSFRHWVGNETNFSREVAEAALALIIGDKAEPARRCSLFNFSRCAALTNAPALLLLFRTDQAAIFAFRQSIFPGCGAKTRMSRID